MFYRSTAAAVAAIVSAIGLNMVALAGTEPATWVGPVDHVSTDNIKVWNDAHTQDISFLLVPKFKEVFSGDGKTTYQMAQIKPGMTVKVYYSQKLLGARHADKIFILNANGQALTSTKS